MNEEDQDDMASMRSCPECGGDGRIEYTDDLHEALGEYVQPAIDDWLAKVTDETQRRRALQAWGIIDKALRCPTCQGSGMVDRSVVENIRQDALAG